MPSIRSGASGDCGIACLSIDELADELGGAFRDVGLHLMPRPLDHFETRGGQRAWAFRAAGEQGGAFMLHGWFA